MTTTTAKGRKLAAEMIKHFDRDEVSTFDLAPALSLLGRLAPTYARIQEHDCNGTKTPAMERREAQIEARARAIVTTMPPATTGPLSVVFTGDPRGYTMRIKVPDAPHDGNTWGRDGEYGIG